MNGLTGGGSFGFTVVSGSLIDSGVFVGSSGVAGLGVGVGVGVGVGDGVAVGVGGVGVAIGSSSSVLTGLSTGGMARLWICSCPSWSINPKVTEPIHAVPAIATVTVMAISIIEAIIGLSALVFLWFKVLVSFRLLYSVLTLNITRISKTGIYQKLPPALY